MPLISVVIPAKNAEATIRETVESALSQTFSDIEIIIVNDDSSDATLEIISKIDDPRVRVVFCCKGNAAASRNLGISHAHGQWIAPLDADDIWLPDKLAQQWQMLQHHPKAAVAYSWVDHINQTGKIIGSGGRCTQSGNVHAKLLLSNILGNGSNPLIRKDALEAISGFDETLSHSEDRDVYIRLAERYEFVLVPKVHLLYRITGQSKSFRAIFRSEAAYLKLIERAYA
jgi:glycosyltransferase involved in cell wall biosynthesis